MSRKDWDQTEHFKGLGAHLAMQGKFYDIVAARPEVGARVYALLPDRAGCFPVYEIVRVVAVRDAQLDVMRTDARLGVLPGPWTIEKSALAPLA